ncbi:hypothetical protein BS78_07G186900 [Paspalum vaginatum]|nr:hypothetical protein BS78_07G186900 [Paspalum vaginatum]
MKIKIGKHEKDDLQLIHGVSTINDMGTWRCSSFRSRIHGDCGAIDLVASRLNNAVETVFSTCLGCFTSGMHEEIHLFDGAIGKSGGPKRSVVAVVLGAQMDLKFKVAANSVHSCRSLLLFLQGEPTWPRYSRDKD